MASQFLFSAIIKISSSEGSWKKIDFSRFIYGFIEALRIWGSTSQWQYPFLSFINLPETSPLAQATFLSEICKFNYETVSFASLILLILLIQLIEVNVWVSPCTQCSILGIEFSITNDAIKYLPVALCPSMSQCSSIVTMYVNTSSGCVQTNLLLTLGLTSLASWRLWHFLEILLYPFLLKPS